MKRLLQLAAVLVLASCASTAFGTVWWVRADGGTRYSSNVTTGRCNGQANAPDPGSGTNQPCAFNDARMLYQDGTPVHAPTDPFPAWGWVGAGGDMYVILGTVGEVSYRVGNSSLTVCSSYPCFGIQGQPQNAGMPTPPSGSSGAHTRLYGGCVLDASCDANNLSTLTELHGGWGALNVLDLYTSNYIDVAGFSLTDFSQCNWSNDHVYPCRDGGGATVSDFAKNGLQMHANPSGTNNVSLNHIRIHGLAAQGIIGPPDDGFTANDLVIVGNGLAGWNADPGDGTTGEGSLSVTNFVIRWNGCAEEYPIVHAIPFFNCTDDATGGYGDGFGTTTVTSPAPWHVSFVGGTVSYNTQDGLDGLHINCHGCTVRIERVLAFGNGGQQIKNGDGAVATVRNNVVNGNCHALTQYLNSTVSVTSNVATFLTVFGDALEVGQSIYFSGLTTLPALNGTTQTVTAADNMTYSIAFTHSNLSTTGETGFSYVPIAGRPAPTQDLIGAPCRAGNTAMLAYVTPDGPLSIQGNTFYSKGSVVVEIEYSDAPTINFQTHFNDNVIVSFVNPESGAYPSPLYSNGGAGGGGGASALATLTTPGASWTNNSTYGYNLAYACPGTGETAALCNSTPPGLTDMTYHYLRYGNVTPASPSSAVVGAGVTISGLGDDFNGNPRPSPPSIGAIEPSGTGAGGSFFHGVVAGAVVQ